MIFSSLKVKGWKGIFIEGGQGENLFRHCRISGAEFGIRSARARLVVDDCRLQENTWGVVAEDGQVDIRGTACGARWPKPASLNAIPGLAVKGSVITENAVGGFLLEGTPSIIEGNNIANNGGWGIKIVGPPTEVHAGSNWWGKGEADLSEVIKGAVLTHPLLPAPISAGFAANHSN